MDNSTSRDAGLTLSDVVHLIRKFYSSDNLGYAEAAQILDRAIEPQLKQYGIQERIDEHQTISNGLVESGTPMLDYLTADSYSKVGRYFNARHAELTALKDNKGVE